MQMNGEIVEHAAPVGRREVIHGIPQGDVEMQIATARKFPRSIKACQNAAFNMAKLDARTAESCTYVLPRAGKTISGPSVRLAEIVALAWTNLHAGARVVAIEEKYVIAEGVAWDLETNVMIKLQNPRRITRKDGTRFDDDMIQVTGLAASGIALRNIIFKIIPRAFWEPVWRDVEKVARGDVKTLTQRRQYMVKWFDEHGVKIDHLLQIIGKPGLEDVGLDEVATLRGIATAIDEGSTSVESLLKQLEAPKDAPGKAKPKSLKEQAQAAGVTTFTANMANKTLVPVPAEPKPDDKALYIATITAAMKKLPVNEFGKLCVNWKLDKLKDLAPQLEAMTLDELRDLRTALQ